MEGKGQILQKKKAEAIHICVLKKFTNVSNVLESLPYVMVI